MRKEELTPAQLTARNTVVSALTAAGWQPRKTNARFDAGWWVAQEAVLDYHNSRARLTLAYSAERGALDFLIEAEPTHLNLVIFAAPEIVSEVLALIVSFQADLSAENCRERVRRLLTPCPEELFLNADGRLIQIK